MASFKSAKIQPNKTQMLSAFGKFLNQIKKIGNCVINRIEPSIRWVVATGFVIGLFSSASIIHTILSLFALSSVFLATLGIIEAIIGEQLLEVKP